MKSKKTKYIHVACVIVGIVIPLVPVIATMADFGQQVKWNPSLQAANVTFTSGGLGFVMNRFPQLLCFGFNGDVVFYSGVLPIILIFYVGITELMLLFAMVYKVSNVLITKEAPPPNLKLVEPPLDYGS
jgi:hypothetical protein